MTNKDILSQLPPSLLEEISDVDLNLMIKRAVELIPNAAKYTEKIRILEVEDYKLELPLDLREIISVYYQRGVTQTLLNECQCESYEYRTTICKPMVYQQILISPEFNNVFERVKYAGRDKSLLCSDCVNLQCNGDKMFTITGRTINTNFDGEICLRYWSLDCNEDGTFEIAQSNSVPEFIITYILKNHWLDRATRKEEGAMQMYANFKQEFDILYRRVRGEFNLRNVNSDSVKSTTFGYFKQFKK